MSAIRVISRLDIKGPNLVKGVHLEGLRVIGEPHRYASNYYEQGADEIIYQDIVASLYGRNSILDLVSDTVSNVFVPMTIGGGIRSIADARQALRSGGDKVVVNTAATKSPELITELADVFGSQCVVVAIEVIETEEKKYKVFTDNGREPTDLEATDWVRVVEELGAGEIILTSVDKEGTYRGFDIDLISAVRSKINIPLIAHGGAGSPEDGVNAVKDGGADAIAIAGVLHYNKYTIKDFKFALRDAGFEVRL